MPYLQTVETVESFLEGKRKPVLKSVIMESTGLSFGAVKGAIEALVSQGKVEVSKTKSHGKGRPSTLVRWVEAKKAP